MIDVEALIHIQKASCERAGRALITSWPPQSSMNATQLVVFLEERR